MRKILSLILVIACSLILISCNTPEINDTATNKDAISPPATTDSSSQTTETNSNTPTIIPEKAPDFELYLYSVNPNTEKLYKSDTINFKGNTTIENCLNDIAKNTSYNSFDGLPITFVKLDILNGKKIAIVNLEEKVENKDKAPERINGSNWLYGFFQGSTGGYITSTILTENFLQKDYKGDWIDGVKFNYGGKPISSQHVESLSDIVYR